MELMSHVALITTLQMTNWVIKCLRMCACAVWHESHTAACSLDSTCNQFGAAQLLWCNWLWNVHMTSTQRGNPELTPVKLCTKSHIQTNTVSMLFTKDWLRNKLLKSCGHFLLYRTPYGVSNPIIVCSGLHAAWGMTADLNGRAT